MREPTESQAPRRWRCRPLAAVAIAALGAVAIAGCGGDDDNDTTTAAQGPAKAGSAGGTGQGSAATSPAGGASTIKISETEYKLTPSNPSVKAGKVSFEVTNDGQKVHSLEVEGSGVEAELEPELAPGESGTLTADVSKPGTYELYCPVDDHKDLGMEGTLTVK